MNAAVQMVLLECLLPVVREAGDCVMRIYATAFPVRMKPDASPVTQADEAAEGLIVPALRALLPGVPVVAEEAVAAGGNPEVGERFWLVDALDGTKEFVKRNGEFTVNVALIQDGVPVLGVVLAPALGRLYLGGQAVGAFVEEPGRTRRAISCRAVPGAGLAVVHSRSHNNRDAVVRFLAGRKVQQWREMGSSLKFCLLACGEADIYPRFSDTMEWDVAAGDAVLRAAGGSVRTLDGAMLRYGKPAFRNPHFVASSAP